MLNIPSYISNKLLHEDIKPNTVKQEITKLSY